MFMLNRPTTGIIIHPGNKMAPMTKLECHIKPTKTTAKFLRFYDTVPLYYENESKFVKYLLTRQTCCSNFLSVSLSNE